MQLLITCFFVLNFMHLSLKMLSGMAISKDPNQTAPYEEV